jgi:hypothetical protein
LQASPDFPCPLSLSLKPLMYTLSTFFILQYSDF